ncbi:LysR family transcriptional regulator [Mesocricetibacter intestinalis]|uniref:LysR family transcriptional regulator n=1 Tax=Mesocricetibacter intestinalis TaxID=1521930 RepID=A0A4R6VBD1_9PAST|nr:LysR family transcriptional regulator [Mesocricetibacter intestinalis]TDQ57451.1 LysR family transcriptional regulator [Mesocricetibacter intestinalis]
MLFDEMSAFVAVARQRSFALAAKTSGIPKSTLSRKISQLEQKLGLRLLNRTTRKIELTEAGERYLERVSPLLEEAKLIQRELTEIQAQPRGRLNISIAPDTANLLIAPLLAEFYRHYPHIQIEFDVTPRRVDLISEHMDLVIRLGELSDSHFIARRLTVLEQGLYAAPDYLRRQGSPTRIETLVQHQCLSTVKNNRWVLHKGKESCQLEIQGNYKMNNWGLALNLALNGLGIGLFPHRLAAPFVAQGRLLHLLPQWQGSAIPVYALTETRLLPAKVQYFLDFLKQQIGKDSG